MNRSNVRSHTGRGLVLVGGVMVMGVSLALAQLAAQTRAPGNQRTSEVRQPQPARTADQRDRQAGQPADGQRDAAAERQLDRQGGERAADRRPGERSERPDRGERGDRETARRSDAPWLGVFLQQGEEAAAAGGAAEVTHVYPASPAARAGLRAGDKITSVNGQKVESPAALIETIDQLKAGDKAQFVVQRRDQELKLNATLASRDSFMFSEMAGSDRGEGEQWASTHDHDEFYDIPEYAMQLEAHRRLAEQHERIENLIQQLRGEVQALREELKTRR